jgi:hypothetical protein
MVSEVRSDKLEIVFDTIGTTRKMQNLFRCISRAALPDDFARLVVDTVDTVEEHDRVRHIAARKLACTEQRCALDAVATARKKQHR